VWTIKTKRHRLVVERQPYVRGGTVILGGGTTTLGSGTVSSCGGTPDTGGGTPFRLNLTTGY